MSVFDILKQQKKELDLRQQQAHQPLTDLQIQLTLDDKGASVGLIDTKGAPVQPDHSAYSGSLRYLIHTLNTITDKNAFLIDWDNPDSRIYLHEHPHLILPVLHSGLLVDSDLRPIDCIVADKSGKSQAAPARFALKAVISPIPAAATKKQQLSDKASAEAYTATLELQAESSAGIENTAKKTYKHFWFIAENYALIPKENKIIETRPVGPFFNQLRIFNAELIASQDLPQYLSLLFTYIEKVHLEFKDYKVVQETEPVKARPAIIFEKMDEDQNLMITIRQNLQSTPIGFLDEYALSHLATVNEMEKTISVCPLSPLNMSHYVSRVAASLKKHLPKGKKKAAELFDIQDQQFFIPENLAGPFIYNELPSLMADYDLIGSEKLKSFKIKVGMPRLDLSLGHNIDFLEGTATLDFEGEKISILDALLQYDKQRYIRLTDGTHALVNEQYMNRLRRLFKKNKNKKGEIAVSFFDLPAIEELIEENQRSAHFAHAREVYQGFNTIAEKGATPPRIQAALRPYQLQGFQWISYLEQHQLGGCLADDMGLGKTIQTIAVLAAAYGGSQPETSFKKQKRISAKTGDVATATKAAKAKKAAKKNQQENRPTEAPLPSIIIMPKSLLFNWQNELKKFAPWLSVYQWYGQNRDIGAAMQHQIILTTYAMFRNDIELWKEQSFLYGILDESQAIKNLNSQTHKAVLLLKARHRLALSGTPVENNLSELFSLFQFLNPALLGTVDQFHKDYLYPIQKNNDREAISELRRKIYPFILRRLKKDVLKDLPDKQEQTIYTEMNSAQAKYYEQRRQFYKEAIDQQVALKGIKQAQFFIFQAMNELRQIASIPEAKTEGRIHSPKLEALMEQLEEAIANDHKVLIFVNYLSAIETIGEALDKLNIGFLTMTGSTRDRQSLVDRFQQDPEIKVFIMTLKTGGTGLNLTAADMVFIFDPWWNKAAENQAIDRAHRIGQTNKVQSYRMITLGTIEEKIQQLQDHKSNLFDELITSDSGSIKSLTEDDIQFVLG